MRALALFLLTAAIACAQFRSPAALVIAPTTVTDSKGKYIDALDPADLFLYDNGMRQPIQVDESYNPISLVVALRAQELLVQLADAFQGGLEFAVVAQALLDHGFLLGGEAELLGASAGIADG